MKSKTKVIIFIILLILVTLFFLWSRLILISLTLILIADSFSTQLFSRFLKKGLANNSYTVLKYSYYMLLPIALLIFVRAFFFDIYFVPSSSMEKTLFPNDYVLVDKVSYGTKVPKYMRDIPIFRSFSKKEVALNDFNLYRPLKKNKFFKREDIVVFKSVQNKETYLIKRIIGLPNETINIKSNQVFINNKKLEDKEVYSYSYIDSTIPNTKTLKTYSNNEFSNLNSAEKIFLRKDNEKPFSNIKTVFPYSYAKKLNWTRDDYGPLVIPGKGMTISIDEFNYDIYKDIIYRFEGVHIKIINGKSVLHTFKNNYYFLMGDNRHSSIDSRYFGLVPENHIQGKMIKVFSKKRLLN